jgi:hypothetical protein
MRIHHMMWQRQTRNRFLTALLGATMFVYPRVADRENTPMQTNTRLLTDMMKSP